MDVSVGQKYKRNKKGSYLLITAVREDKIKFEVYGNKFPGTSGSMSLEFFSQNYSSRDLIKTKT